MVECPKGWFEVSLVASYETCIVVKWRRWFSDDSFRYLRLPKGQPREWYFGRLVTEGEAVHRPTRGEGAGQASTVQVDTAFQTDYPSLWKFLADAEYDDGGNRERGSLRLSWDPNRGWTAYLRDPTAACIAFRNAADLETLLMECDAFCGDPRADWEPDKYATPKPAKKGKK